MKLSGKPALEFTDSPRPDIWAALLFCDDDGVAADAARALVSVWSRQAESERRVLTEDEVARDPAILFDAIEARSLLGGRTIIELRLTGEKLGKTLLDAIALGAGTGTLPDNRLAIISGGLRTSSRLRKGFEAADTAVALQLYADSQEDADQLVSRTLESAGVEIAPDALAAFTSGLPGHRRLAHAELEKLTLYARGLERPVSLEDVRALAASDTDHQLSGLIDAVFAGEGARALRELERLESAGSNAITVLRALQREAQRMLSAHAAGGGNVGMKLRPPVYPQNWPAFQARLRKWPGSALIRLLERIHDTEQTARLSGATADPNLRMLVNDMTRAAGRR